MSFKLPRSIVDNSYGEIAGALITESIEQHKVFHGEAFACARRFTIVSQGVHYIVFDPTAVTKDYVVLLPLKFSAFGAGPLEVDIFLDPDVTGGTIDAPINRDFTSNIVAETVLTVNPAVNSPGTKLGPEYYVFSNGQAAKVIVGGEVGDTLPLVLDTTHVYMLRVTNTDAQTDAKAQCAIDFFEFNKGHS